MIHRYTQTVITYRRIYVLNLRGWRLENKMVLVLWEFNRSFHIVKYLGKAVIVWLSLYTRTHTHTHLTAQ
jgi:hypothetical protein